MKKRSMFLVPLLVTKPKLLTEKQIHELKISGYVLLGDLTQDYNLGEGISESSEELFHRARKDSRYLGVFTGMGGGNCSRSTSRLPLIIILKRNKTGISS